MPWELGYFDGYKPNKIGILPLVSNSTDAVRGVEYLGLYPLIDRIGIGRTHRFEVRSARGQSAQDLRALPWS
jgi:hypothetical protein